MAIVVQKRSGRPSVRPDNDTVMALYKDHTAPEIASMYGVKEATVRSWIARIRRAERGAVNG